MIVDDEPYAIENILYCLKYFTYKDRKPEIQKFTNAMDTIEALKKEDPENPETAVIILNFLMPGGNGDLVIHYLRETVQNHITQIIMETAGFGLKSDHGHLKTMETMKIDDYLDKDAYMHIRLPTSLYIALRNFEFRLLSAQQIRRLNAIIEKLNKEINKC